MSKLIMKTLPVIIIIVVCLDLLVSATDFYWMASGNTCQKSYGRHNLCIHYSSCLPDPNGGPLKGHTEICHFVGFKCIFCCVENDKSEESDESYEIEKIPPLYHNPAKSIGSHPWDISEEYWGSDEHDYDYSHHHFNSGASPEHFFGGPYYDWMKPQPSHNSDGNWYNKWGANFPYFHNENDVPTPSPDGLDPSNRGQDGDALTDNDGISASIITNSTEGLNVQEPFYRPTIQNSTSLRRCSEFFRTDENGTSDIAVVGGENARPKEFPHIALLGFGDPNNISWQCGGSLISEQYVLTAAHCTFSRTQGAVRYVRLGELDLNSTTDDAIVADFTIAEVITHPLYDFRSSYHDIALIRLNTSITSFNDYVKPACLATTKNLEDVDLNIAGWGVVEDDGPKANILQTARLTHVPHARCRMNYGRSVRLRQGIIEDVHVCADGGTERRDACNGDSGGPLQFTNNDYADDGILSFVELAGVTSFGYSCAKIPGVYTRVLPYVKWIESIVWP